MDSATFHDKLFDAQILVPAGVDGLYGRSGKFDDWPAGARATLWP